MLHSLSEFGHTTQLTAGVATFLVFILHIYMHVCSSPPDVRKELSHSVRCLFVKAGFY